MGYIVALVALIIGLMNHLKKRTWVNPTSLFCYLWAVISFLAALCVYGINQASTRTWLVILCGILSFAIGSSIQFESRMNMDDKLYSDKAKVQLLSSKYYWLIFGIVIITLLGEVVSTIKLIQQGYQLSSIRLAKLGLTELNGYTKNRNLIYNYWIELVSGFSTILVAVGIEYFFSSIKTNKKYLIAALVLVIFDAISEGGRWILAYAAIEFVVCYCLKKDELKHEISIKRNMKIGLVSVCGVIAFLVNKITSLRSIDNSKQHFISYLCGCVPLLDKKLDYLHSNSIITISYSGLYGIWSYIMPYFNKMFGEIPLMYEKALDVRRNAQSFEYIGADVRFNAFSTSFYYLYADLSWVGVIIGMLFFGVVASKVYNNARTGTSNCVAPYLIVSQMILKTIQIYPLSSSSYFVVIVALIIINRIRLNKYKSAIAHNSVR